jgi:hypothetical protein
MKLVATFCFTIVHIILIRTMPTDFGFLAMDIPFLIAFIHSSLFSVVAAARVTVRDLDLI